MKLSIFKKALQREINVIRLLFVIFMLIGVLNLFKFGEYAFGASAMEIDKYFSQRANINSNIKANQNLYFDTDINNVPKAIKPIQ